LKATQYIECLSFAFRLAMTPRKCHPKEPSTIYIPFVLEKHDQMAHDSQFINGYQQLSGVARCLLSGKESSTPDLERKEWMRAMETNMEKIGANCALRPLTNPIPKE
jgi:hypothetical protein